MFISLILAGATIAGVLISLGAARRLAYIPGQFRGDGQWNWNWKAKFMLALAVINVILLATAPMSIFTIPTGQIGVVKVFGAVKEVVGPGVHCRFWMTNSVDIYDTKTREIELEFQAYSKDAQTITGKLAVQYQIQQENALSIARQYGRLQTLEQKLQAVILERAKSVFSDKGAMTIIETRSTLSNEIGKRIATVTGQYFVTVTTVALADFSFNDAFENAVEQKMVAEQEKLRANYDKEKAIIKAEEQLAVAERAAQAVIQKANGDAEALQIMRTAWSTSSAEVKDAMLRQTFYEKWNGVLPEVVAGDKLDLIIGGRRGKND